MLALHAAWSFGIAVNPSALWRDHIAWTAETNLAEKLIAVLQRREGQGVDLIATPVKTKRPIRRSRKSSRSAKVDDRAALARKPKSPTTKPKRTGKKKAAATSEAPAQPNGKSATPPTARMIAYAESLAKSRKTPLPAGYDKDFQTCRQFLDQHGGRS